MHRSRKLAQKIVPKSGLRAALIYMLVYTRQYITRLTVARNLNGTKIDSRTLCKYMLTIIQLADTPTNSQCVLNGLPRFASAPTTCIFLVESTGICSLHCLVK